MASDRCQVQRCYAAFVDVGPASKQRLDDSRLTFERCQVQRRVFVGVRRVEFGPAVGHSFGGGFGTVGKGATAGVFDVSLNVSGADGGGDGDDDGRRAANDGRDEGDCPSPRVAFPVRSGLASLPT